MGEKGMAAQKDKAGDAPHKEQELPVVSKEPVPEIFVDGFVGMLVRSGCAKFNLYSNVQELSTFQPVRQVIARLTMPVPVLLAFHEALGRAITDMEKDGVFAREPEKAEVEK
jgi:hypothetical protein